MDLSKLPTRASWDQWLRNLQDKKLYNLDFKEGLQVLSAHVVSSSQIFFANSSHSYDCKSPHCYVFSWGSSGAALLLTSWMGPFLKDNLVCSAAPGPTTLSCMPGESRQRSLSVLCLGVPAGTRRHSWYC